MAKLCMLLLALSACCILDSSNFSQTGAHSPTLLCCLSECHTVHEQVACNCGCVRGTHSLGRGGLGGDTCRPGCACVAEADLLIRTANERGLSRSTTNSRSSSLHHSSAETSPSGTFNLACPAMHQGQGFCSCIPLCPWFVHMSCLPRTPRCVMEQEAAGCRPRSP